MSLPETYRKVVVNRPGRDFRSAVDIVEVKMEPPGPEEIIVRNLFAGVNASDVNISAGVYFGGAPPPYDTGVEASGEVVAVGDQVQGISVGDHVLTGMLGGGYTEYYTINAGLAVPIPQASAEITCIAVGALTAAMALEISGNMGSDEVVFITAAAGGVGHFAVQVAKQAGNHVIGTCGSDEKAALLRELGADRVINYRTENVGDVLQNEYPNGINLVLEGVGGEIFDASVANLAKRGRIVLIGFVSEYKDDPEIVTAPRLYHHLLWKSATVSGFLYSDYLEHYGTYLQRVLEAFADGHLRAVIDPENYTGVESVVDAVERLQNGNNLGKVIVRF